MATSTNNSKEYEPVGRWGFSIVRVDTCLYMWGGVLPALPSVQNSKEKVPLTSYIEIFNLLTGKWKQRSTTGNPPLGISGYSATAINDNLYYFGGYLGYDECYSNSLHCLNVHTLHWRTLTSSDNASCPSKKKNCGMIALNFKDGDNYLVVFGGKGPASNNIPHQLGAQYSKDRIVGDFLRNNEIHFYNLSSGHWISPVVIDNSTPSIGNRPQPCDSFTFDSLSDDSAILFGGGTPNGASNDTYIAKFTKSTVIWTKLNITDTKPEGRAYHSSVCINSESKPHLLVTGGTGTNDCWLLDINKGIWKEVTVARSITERWGHSMEKWNINSTTWWIVEFGGDRVFESPSLSNTAVIEFAVESHLHGDWWSISIVSPEEYEDILAKKSLPTEAIPLSNKHASFMDDNNHDRQYFLKSMKHLQSLLDEERNLTSKLVKQKDELLEKVKRSKENPNKEMETIQLLNKKLDEEKKIEKTLRKELHKEIEILQQQLQAANNKTVKDKAVQFDCLLPHIDIFQHDITLVKRNLFHLQGSFPHSFNWDKYGFRLFSPQGTVGEQSTCTCSCEISVAAIVNGPFNFPKGTVLVSGVYAISVSRPLLKPLSLQLEHCVDLRTSGQTDCLMFVLAPLQSYPPYQFQVVEEGFFSIGNRYGTISRKEFCYIVIVAKMSEGEENSRSSSEEGDPTLSDDSSHYSTPSQGSIDEEVKEEDRGEDKGQTKKQQEEIHVCQRKVSSITSSDLEESETINEVTCMSTADFLYTGMMYHNQKGTSHWKTMYTVVKDLEILKEYLREEHAHAERDVVVTFKFIEPNGTMQLILNEIGSAQQIGWTVHPDRYPMELYQSVIERFPVDPIVTSCSYSIYVDPEVAVKSFHCGVQLLGINPSLTIYINIPLPKAAGDRNSDQVVVRNDSNETETVRCGFMSDIAHQVICSNNSLIKESQINLYSLADKLMQYEIINDMEKKQLTDDHCGLTVDQRMDKLLNLVSASVKLDGNDFGLFLDVLRQENTRRAKKLADKLLESYRLLC